MKLEITYKLIVFAIFLGGSSLNAFELRPERRSILRSDLSTTPSSDIGSEFAADLISFEPPDQYYFDLYSHPNSLHFSVGSLGGNHFNFYRNIQIQKDLSKKHIFDFSSLEHESFHIKKYDALLHYSYIWTNKVRVGLGGQVFHLKANNDVGVFAEYTSSTGAKHTVRHSWQNYSQNERSSNTETFRRGHHPNSISYQYLNYETNHLRRFTTRVDTLARWLTPDTNQEYVIGQRLIQWIDIKTNNSKQIESSLKLKYKESLTEEHTLNSSINSSLQKSQLRINYMRKFKNIWSGLSQNSWGLDFHSLDYKSLSKESKLEYVSLIYQFQKSKSNFTHKLVATNYEHQGDKSLLPVSKDQDFNLRFDGGYLIPLEDKNFRWVWGFSIDIDRFGQDDTWEGGFSKLSYVF